MFVRAKLIKGTKYAYLVNNIWKDDKVKQKVKKYLGKIIDFDKLYVENQNFVSKTSDDFDWMMPTKLLFREIISEEFLRRGFKRKGWQLIKNDLIINLSTCKITQDEKDVVLFMNGRYLYDSLIKELENFYEPEDEYAQKGEKLAQAFSDCGISIEKDVFIKLYQKIYQ
jgi:hypothetical protein